MSKPSVWLPIIDSVLIFGLTVVLILVITSKIHINGSKGSPGKDGADGSNGTDGTDGTDGANGTDLVASSTGATFITNSTFKFDKTIDPKCNIHSIYPFYPTSQQVTMSCILPDVTGLSDQGTEGIFIGSIETARVYCFHDKTASTRQRVEFLVNNTSIGSPTEYYSGDRLVIYLDGTTAKFDIRGINTLSDSETYTSSSADTLYIGFISESTSNIGSVTVKDFSFSFTGVT